VFGVGIIRIFVVLRVCVGFCRFWVLVGLWELGVFWLFYGILGYFACILVILCVVWVVSGVLCWLGLV